DDGVFCNGDDRCVAGACVNDGPPPCALASCDEAARTCVVGCDTVADCPSDVVGDWGECAFADECAEAGERARMVTSFACVDRRCTPQARTESEACARSTAGATCGDGDGCDTWTECRFDPCATAGAQYRTCWTSRCLDGRCATSSRSDSMPCSRGSQEGTVCAEATGFGYCYGICAGGSCGSLCEYCAGFCSLTGCRESGGAMECPAP
ncbi:MAG: hypothetical protein KC619_25665, partial [Myxococcales bacterium]|nr:hypothetical protein [Myxococcales bacterium]